MEVSTVTYVASAAYIAVTGALLGALALFAVPAVMITRRRASYFDDWNDTLQAPWLFWHIGGLLFRAQELFGNYVLPAPQRVCDLAYSHFRSQVRQPPRGWRARTRSAHACIWASWRAACFVEPQRVCKWFTNAEASELIRLHLGRHAGSGTPPAPKRERPQRCQLFRTSHS